MTTAKTPPQPTSSAAARAAKLRLRALIVVLAAGSVGALFWGISAWKARSAREARLAQSGRVLKVLTIEGVLSPELIAKFEGETGTRLLVDDVASPDDIWSRLLEAEALPPGDETGAGTRGAPTEPAAKPASISRLYDVIALFSFQVHAATLRDRIARLNSEVLPALESASIDFRDLPLESGRDRFVPLLWGINGIALDTSRAGSRHESWESVFSDPALKGRIALLGSPLDVLYVLTHRRGQSEALALLESDDDPDERAEELRRPLNSLAQEAKILQERAFIGPAALTETARAAAAIQISHGEAASHFGSLPDGDLKEPWKFILPTEKSPLWILGFSMTEGTPRENEALRFLEFLLAPETAKDITLRTGVASTNIALERDRSLHPWLKPSHLRRVPFRQLHFVRDFHAGPAVRGVIRSAAARAAGQGPQKPTQEKPPDTKPAQAKPASAQPRPTPPPKPPAATAAEHDDELMEP